MMYMQNKYKDALPKLFWLVAPLVWGVFTWIMAFGQGSTLLSYLIPQSAHIVDNQINLAFRAVIGFGLVVLLLGRSFSYAEKHFKATFYGYTISLPPWWSLIGVVLLGHLISFFFIPLWQYQFVNSFVVGVLLSSTIEELIAHGFFTKYNFSRKEFIYFNGASAITFLLMHLGYCKEIYLSNLIHPMNTLILPIARFIFPLLFGFIAYKTKRIEGVIILHMLVNLMYVISKFVFNLSCSYDPLIICTSLLILFIIAYGAGNKRI